MEPNSTLPEFDGEPKAHGAGADDDDVWVFFVQPIHGFLLLRSGSRRIVYFDHPALRPAGKAITGREDNAHKLRV